MFLSFIICICLGPYECQKTQIKVIFNITCTHAVLMRLEPILQKDCLSLSRGLHYTA